MARYIPDVCFLSAVTWVPPHGSLQTGNPCHLCFAMDGKGSGTCYQGSVRVTALVPPGDIPGTSNVPYFGAYPGPTSYGTD